MSAQGVLGKLLEETAEPKKKKKVAEFSQDLPAPPSPSMMHEYRHAGEGRMWNSPWAALLPQPITHIKENGTRKRPKELQQKGKEKLRPGGQLSQKSMIASTKDGSNHTKTAIQEEEMLK